MRAPWGSSCIRARRRSGWPAHPGVEGIFAVAEERQVPMLIHAGAGLPPEFGAELVEVVERHPNVRLILAHMGITDQAVIADGLRGYPSVVYDSSWMNAFEMMTLLARIPAERIVFGSDPPYGRTFNGLYLLLRSLRCLGVEGDHGGRGARGKRATDARRRAAGRRPRLHRLRASFGSTRACFGFTRTA